MGVPYLNQTTKQKYCHTCRSLIRYKGPDPGEVCHVCGEPWEKPEDWQPFGPWKEHRWSLVAEMNTIVLTITKEEYWMLMDLTQLFGKNPAKLLKMMLHVYHKVFIKDKRKEKQQ
jgi:hypothetical protein